MEIRQDSKLMWVSCLECWHRKTGEHQTPVFERLYSSIQLINNYALNSSSYGSAFPIECYLPARYHYKSFAELRLECKSKTNTVTMFSCMTFTTQSSCLPHSRGKSWAQPLLVCSAVSPCVQSHSGEKFTSQGCEYDNKHDLFDIFLASLWGAFLTKFVLTQKERAELPIARHFAHMCNSL